jgi:hypothetical protein
VFPVRYELNSYMLFRRNSVFKELIVFELSCRLRNEYKGLGDEDDANQFCA